MVRFGNLTPLVISPPAPSSEPPPPYSPPRLKASTGGGMSSKISFPFFPSELSLAKKAKAALNIGSSNQDVPVSPPPYRVTEEEKSPYLKRLSMSDLDDVISVDSDKTHQINSPTYKKSLRRRSQFCPILDKFSRKYSQKYNSQVKSPFLSETKSFANDNPHVDRNSSHYPYYEYQVGGSMPRNDNLQKYISPTRSENILDSSHEDDTKRVQYKISNRPKYPSPVKKSSQDSKLSYADNQKSKLYTYDSFEDCYCGIENCNYNAVHQNNLPTSSAPEYTLSDCEDVTRYSRARRKNSRAAVDMWRKRQATSKVESSNMNTGGGMRRRDKHTVRLERDAAYGMTPARALPVTITTPRMRSCKSLDELSDLLQEDFDLLDTSDNSAPSTSRSLDDLSEPFYTNVPLKCSSPHVHSPQPPPLPAKSRKISNSIASITQQDYNDINNLREQLEKIKQVAMVLDSKVKRGEFAYAQSESKRLADSNSHPNNGSFLRILKPQDTSIPPGVPTRAPVINDVSYLLNKDLNERRHPKPYIKHNNVSTLNRHFISPRERSFEEISARLSSTPDLESSSHESGYSSTDSRSGQSHLGISSPIRPYKAGSLDRSFTRRSFSPPSKQVPNNNFSISTSRVFPSLERQLSCVPPPPPPKPNRGVSDTYGSRSRLSDCKASASVDHAKHNSPHRIFNSLEQSGSISTHNKLYGSMDQLKVQVDARKRLSNPAARPQSDKSSKVC